MDKSELNKIDGFIKNKIGERSKDELIFNSIKHFDIITKQLGIQYSIIGSCGVRSFLPYFSHLPNDLDVIIDDFSKSKLKDYCIKENITYFNELGRDRIQLGGFLIHLIPYRMNIIDKSNNKIFTQINLDINDKNTEIREIILASCLEKIKLKVHIKEIQLLLSLLTPINTTIFHDLISLLENNLINPNLLIEFQNLNLNMKLLFQTRFQEFILLSDRFKNTMKPEVNKDIKLIYNKLFKIEE